MELDPAPTSPRPRSRYLSIADVRSGDSAGVALERPGAPLRTLVDQACRELGQRSQRALGLRVVRLREEELDGLAAQLRRAVRRLLSRGIAPRTLAVGISHRAPGLSRHIATASQLGVSLAVEVCAAELRCGALDLAAAGAAAGSHRVRLHVIEARDLEDLVVAHEARADWISGPVLGGRRTSPRRLGATHRAMLQAARLPRDAAQDDAAHLTNTQRAVRTLTLLTRLGADGAAADLFAGVERGLAAAQEQLGSARATRERASASAAAADAHLSGLLHDVETGRPPRAERLVAAIQSWEAAAALHRYSVEHEREVARRANSLRAGAELRIEALHAAIQGRRRHPQRQAVATL